MESADVLGIRIDAWHVDDLIDVAVRWASDTTGSQRTILYANVHVLNTAYNHPILFRQLRTASTVYCDGSGVRLGARLLRQRLPARMTGADWIDPLCQRMQREGLGLFLLGGAPGVAARAADTLIGRFPGLKIAGTHHGYDEGSENLLGAINRSGAGVLLVGMGTPRQETWLARHRAQLHVPVAWAVGALLDFVAGVERRAPAWVREHHLEWAGRLAANPSTHWRRYIIGNPLFMARIVRQRLVGLPARLTRSDDGAI